ncbi:F-box protein [Rhodotorula paludigena]|uniref:F-box protein n=1 Tax=Rhodotorula paludigena TaxID=86838 RepID=UPI00317E0FA6
MRLTVQCTQRRAVLPTELVSLILDQLDLADVARCRLVSRAFKTLIGVLSLEVAVEEGHGDGEYFFGFLTKREAVRLAVARSPRWRNSVRRLELNFYEAGHSGQQPGIWEDLPLDAPEHATDGTWLDGSWIRDLHSSFPDVVELVVDVAEGAFAADPPDFDPWKRLRRLEQHAFDAKAIVANPHLVHLETWIGALGLSVEPPPALETLVLHDPGTVIRDPEGGSRQVDWFLSSSAFSLQKLSLSWSLAYSDPVPDRLYSLRELTLDIGTTEIWSRLSLLRSLCSLPRTLAALTLTVDPYTREVDPEDLASVWYYPAYLPKRLRQLRLPEQHTPPAAFLPLIEQDHFRKLERLELDAAWSRNQFLDRPDDRVQIWQKGEMLLLDVACGDLGIELWTVHEEM